MDLKARHASLRGKTFLICIGAAKCATSWLHACLDATPGIVVSPLKELQFFQPRDPRRALADMDALALERLAFHIAQPGDAAANLRDRPTFQASVDRAQMIYDPEAYFDHFARLCGPDTRGFADLTPAYSALGPEGFARMQTFSTDRGVRPRVLFVMRDPVDRFWSQIRHLDQIRGEDHLTANWQNAVRDPALLARADYKGIVTALDALFAPEDLLYLFYETLFDGDALDRVCRFAGGTGAPATRPGPRNKTRNTCPLPEAARHALIRGFAPQYAFCRDRFGDRVPDAWAG
ncbi:sulfotransferase [Roseovarius aestuariivivens]|uniref:sulfotransferase n=1 Tax=Roseovarius aestuariivivens TaxID=1888910 RepID=UPI0010815DEE|nr:sulfotransferase [Roseovarius aestuariivivens]